MGETRTLVTPREREKECLPRGQTPINAKRQKTPSKMCNKMCKPRKIPRFPTAAELFELLEKAVECYEDEFKFTDDMVARLKLLLREVSDKYAFSANYKCELGDFKKKSEDTVMFVVRATHIGGSP